MKPKLVALPSPTKRRIRIRIGITVYELSVNIAITPMPLQRPAPLIVMPDGNVTLVCNLARLQQEKNEYIVDAFPKWRGWTVRRAGR